MANYRAVAHWAEKIKVNLGMWHASLCIHLAILRNSKLIYPIEKARDDQARLLNAPSIAVARDRAKKELIASLQKRKEALQKYNVCGVALSLCLRLIGIGM